ncbi:MAG: hypothetical protein Q8P23_00845 [bacterium]|nr:hypothetical protein [bacterium]
MTSRYVTSPRSGARVPEAHRPNETGIDLVASLLHDLLDKQTEIWRWNVGPYVLKRDFKSGETVVSKQELTLARFTNPTGLGGSLVIGMFGISDPQVQVNVEIDDQILTFKGTDLVDANVAMPYMPSFVLSRMDPSHTFLYGALAGVALPLYNFVINMGEIRGIFWRRKASLSVINLASSNLTVYQSEFTTKLYTE